MSLVFTKKRIKALTIRIDKAIVIMVTMFRNRLLSISFRARLKNRIIILDFGFSFLLPQSENAQLDVISYWLFVI